MKVFSCSGESRGGEMMGHSGGLDLGNILYEECLELQRESIKV